MVQALNISETGRRAFAAGLKVKDCPFAIRSSARTWWLKGYREAKAKAAAPQLQITAIGFLDWWKTLSYVKQQCWLLERERRCKADGVMDSNYSVAHANQKEVC